MEKSVEWAKIDRLTTVESKGVDTSFPKSSLNIEGSQCGGVCILEGVKYGGVNFACQTTDIIPGYDLTSRLP